MHVYINIIFVEGVRELTSSCPQRVWNEGSEAHLMATDRLRWAAVCAAAG